MDRKASVEVPEDDKPDVITPLRNNRITLDSYIVPVVFEKFSPNFKEGGQYGKEGRQASSFDSAINLHSSLSLAAVRTGACETGLMLSSPTLSVYRWRGEVCLYCIRDTETRASDCS